MEKGQTGRQGSHHQWERLTDHDEGGSHWGKQPCLKYGTEQWRTATPVTASAPTIDYSELWGFYFWVRWIVTLLSWDWFTSLDFHFRLQFRTTQQAATLISDISYLQSQCNEEAATPRFSKSSDHCCFLHSTTIWGGIQWLLCSHCTMDRQQEVTNCMTLQ